MQGRGVCFGALAVWRMSPQPDRNPQIANNPLVELRAFLQFTETKAARISGSHETLLMSGLTKPELVIIIAYEQLTITIE